MQMMTADFEPKKKRFDLINPINHIRNVRAMSCNNVNIIS